MYATYKVGADTVTKKLGSRPKLIASVNSKGQGATITLDIKSYAANYKSLTVNDFFIGDNQANFSYSNPVTLSGNAKLYLQSYNSQAGLLYIGHSNGEWSSQGSSWIGHTSIIVGVYLL